VLTVAQIAGIQAAKRTSELIPLCHPLGLSCVEVTFQCGRRRSKFFARRKTSALTGVEMEALTGVSVAALTLYDMCKAVDKTMRIEAIRVLKKSKNENRAHHHQRSGECGDLRRPQRTGDRERVARVFYRRNL